jgi:hypothetical protein
VHGAPWWVTLVFLAVTLAPIAALYVAACRGGENSFCSQLE